jgi:hypothetical protein
MLALIEIAAADGAISTILQNALIVSALVKDETAALKAAVGEKPTRAGDRVS